MRLLYRAVKQEDQFYKDQDLCSFNHKVREVKKKREREKEKKREKEESEK